MKVANLGNFNLLNGVSTVGAIAIADGLSSIIFPPPMKNSVQMKRHTSERNWKLVAGSMALFLGTRFSVSINDFPAVVRPLLQRNLQLVLSCGGSGILMLGLKDALSGSQTGIKKGIAQFAVGAAALTARLGA